MLHWKEQREQRTTKIQENSQKSACTPEEREKKTWTEKPAVV